MLFSFNSKLIQRPYATIPMDEEYQIEKRDPHHHHAPKLHAALPSYKATLDLNQSFNEGLFFDWAESVTPKIPKTQYLSPEEAELLHQQVLDDNIIVDAATQKKHAAGMSLFVMTAEGEFYSHIKITPTSETVGFNHSSFFKGKKVAGAGFFHFDNEGRLVGIDNYSGHYKPTTEQVLNAMHSLMLKGIDLSKVRYEHRIDPKKTDKVIFNNALEWFQSQVQLVESRTIPEIPVERKMIMVNV